MTLDAIVLLSLTAWIVVVPMLVVGLRLRRARFADGLVSIGSPEPVRAPRRACEARSRSRFAARQRRHTAGSS